MARQQQVIKSIDGITRPLPQKPRKQKGVYVIRLGKSHLLYVFLGLGVVAAVVLVLGLRTLGGKQNQDSVEVVKQEVARHMVLPTNEQPALATITDHNKLSTPFLKQTQNGDKLLIYQTNKKVIIYRPSIDRIINVGPVVIDSASPSTSQ